MSTPDPLFFDLQQMIIDLSLIDRNHYLAKTSRRENDTEHSMTVALLSWYIHDRHKINLDIAMILKYSISHDFVERYAGDVNTFASASARAAKIQSEQQSLERLSREFSGFPDMVTSMQNYEHKQDEESLFVWTVDKMQALIMGDMDGWRPYAELEITYEQFCDKYKELLEGSSPYCQEIFEGLIEYCKTTYYDQP